MTNVTKTFAIILGRRCIDCYKPDAAEALLNKKISVSAI